MRNLFWITAFTIPAFITLMVISYMHGSIRQWEHMRAENVHYKQRYETLADNADFLTVLQTEAKFQGAKQ